MKKTICILPLLIVTISSCHKYPEDEANIHLRNAYKRIYGEWTVTQYEVDGVDSTASFQNNPDYYCKYTFYKRHSQYDFRKLSRYACNHANPADSYWAFQFRGESYLHVGKIGNTPEGTEWEILRLDKTDMKLKVKYNLVFYIIELKKK